MNIPAYFRHSARTLLGQAHVLVISLLLISFTLSSTTTPLAQTPQTQPSKTQSITRLSSAPSTANTSHQNDASTSSANGAMESTDQTPTPTPDAVSKVQPSSSSTSQQTDPPASAVLSDPVPCSTGCSAPSPVAPQPTPISGCGVCGGARSYGTVPSHQMCPMYCFNSIN
jgi:hypothetical protein